MNPAVLGLLRALGVVVIFAVLTFLANAANLTPVLGESGAALVAMIALALEHAFEGNTGKALFGAARKV